MVYAHGGFRAMKGNTVQPTKKPLFCASQSRFLIFPSLIILIFIQLQVCYSLELVALPPITDNQSPVVQAETS